MRDEDNGFVDLSDWLGQGPDQPEGGAVPEGTAEAEPEPEPEPAPVPTSDAKPAWVPESEPAAKSAPQLQGSAPKGKGLDRRRVLAVIVAAAAAAALCLAYYVSTLYAPVTLGGRVSDYDTGLAVMGATVEVTAEDGQVVTATADRDGWWSVDVGRGDFEVSVSADDYEGTEDSFTVPVGEHGAPAHDFELHRQAHVLSGTVYDNATGAPLAGVKITVDSDEGYPDMDVYLGDDGTYSLELKGTSFDGEVCVDGYQPREFSYDDVAGVDAWDIGLDASVYMLQGTVYLGPEESPGGPLADAQIFIYDSNHAFLGEVRSAADGTYSYQLPAAGDYVASATKVGLRSHTYGFWVDDEESVEDFDFYPQDDGFDSNGGVTCMVYDASTGEAIEDATVTPVSYSSGYPYTTNSHGIAHWVSKSEGDYPDTVLSISAEGYVTQEITFHQQLWAVDHVEVALQPAG